MHNPTESKTQFPASPAKNITKNPIESIPKLYDKAAFVEKLSAILRINGIEIIKHINGGIQKSSMFREIIRYS